MPWLPKFKINHEGLIELAKFVREKFSPEDAKRFGEIMDKTVEFDQSSIVGIAAEALDGKFFTNLYEKGGDWLDSISGIPST